MHGNRDQPRACAKRGLTGESCSAGHTGSPANDQHVPMPAFVCRAFSFRQCGRDEPGVKDGEVGTADCTLEMSAEDWKTISDDPTKAMPLFFQGKLKVAGNAMLATQLQKLLG